MKIIQCAVFLAAAVDGSKATMDTPGFVNLPNPVSNRLAAFRTCNMMTKHQLPDYHSTSKLLMNKSDEARELEIRKKVRCRNLTTIEELKKQGKIKSSPTSPSDEPNQSLFTPTGNKQLDNIRKSRQELRLDKSAVNDYADKLGARLGKMKSRALGMNLPTTASKIVSDTMDDEDSDDTQQIIPQLGSLSEESMAELDDDDGEDYMTEEEVQQQFEVEAEIAKDAIDMLRRNVIEEEEEEMSEDDLMDIVSRAITETGFKPSRERSLEEDGMQSSPASITTTVATATSTVQKTTSGVGGSWAPTDEKTDEYKPSKSGTWGVFPRPKSISQAYGGGRRVGAGVTSVPQDSAERTRELLRAYQEKVGIDVQSEKDHKEIIEEALELAGRAMQRGSYGVGISALEKVTQYCSTRSEVGGNVFLNLAMLYEAEANADKLLYGLEAMQFMRNEAKIKEFSRRSAADTFIDATGFKDMSSKFDDVYNTAYLDLEKGQYYRILTENVVRSTREARQILLKAVGSGEVERRKIVQALRSISRHFDDALEEEKTRDASKNIPVDYAGRPILQTGGNDRNPLVNSFGADGFVLSEATQTLANLDGKWKLQLMADRSGDGVDFFNTTLIYQVIDSSERVYKSKSQGVRISKQSGSFEFDGENRILTREGAKPYKVESGGSLFGMFGDNKRSRGVKMANIPQQVLSVDSVLLITRALVKASAADNIKDYYSVWRKLPGK
eukprot:scaffold284863_cov93-Cyclotella_meneghiniana.AAC.4